MSNFCKSALLLGSFEGQLDSICDALASTGFVVRHALNLSAAIRKQKQAPCSVVVCDLANFSDCLKALKSLRDVDPSAAIIMLAPTSGWRWVDLLENGAFDVLPDPCPTADLVWMVKTALRPAGVGMAVRLAS